MAIPEHIKRKAMDAVASYETTPFIRLNADVAASVKNFPEPVDAPPARRSLSSEEIKMAAMDAVTHHETMGHPRPAPFDGRVFPMHTPTMANARAAERIAQLHESGLHVDTVHGWATKDHFGRDHG